MNLGDINYVKFSDVLFPEKDGGGGDDALYSYCTLFFKDMSVCYIVVMNPTWASDGSAQVRSLNTQGCLWGDSTVLYLLILSAFGSGGSYKPYFPLSPKPSVDAKRVVRGTIRCRREGTRTLNEIHAGYAVFCNRDVGNRVGCGISDALNHALCRINWYLLNRPSRSLVSFVFSSVCFKEMTL